MAVGRVVERAVAVGLGQRESFAPALQGRQGVAQVAVVVAGVVGEGQAADVAVVGERVDVRVHSVVCLWMECYVVVYEGSGSALFLFLVMLMLMLMLMRGCGDDPLT